MKTIELTFREIGEVVFLAHYSGIHQGIIESFEYNVDNDWFPEIVYKVSIRSLAHMKLEITGKGLFDTAQELIQHLKNY